MRLIVWKGFFSWYSVMNMISDVTGEKEIKFDQAPGPLDKDESYIVTIVGGTDEDFENIRGLGLRILRA